MDGETAARQAVADAGRRLLAEGLVARTWGNVSCRTGSDTFVITPSGLAYDAMTAQDVVPYDMGTGTWTGTRKPSSEKGVHAAAYAQFAEVGFVIHTHQPYASALGMTGFDRAPVPEEASKALGGIALARYGLPGTKRLRENVRAALATGAHVVLMAQHGALIAGKDLQEAFQRARQLELLSRNACAWQPARTEEETEPLASLVGMLAVPFRQVVFTVHPAVVEASAACGGFRAQLDDMAQMIGPRLRVVKADVSSIATGLRNQSAVLVEGCGAVCRADTTEDAHALQLLVEKACVGFLHTRAAGVRVALSMPDAWLMRLVYVKKYAGKIRA